LNDETVKGGSKGGAGEATSTS